MVGCFAAGKLPSGYDSSFEIDHDVQMVIVKDQDHGGVKEKVLAHKVVLALASDKFRKMFTNSKEEVTEVMMESGCSSEVIRQLVKYCYTTKISLAGRDLPFLVQLYSSAAALHIPGVQSLVLRQKVISQITQDDNRVSPGFALEIVNYTLQCPEHVLLVEALLKKAAAVLRTYFEASPSEIVPFIRENIQDENIIQVLVRKLQLEDLCKNCKRFQCINGKEVNERNFVVGARVKIKNRAGKGNAALVKLGNIDDRNSKEFFGFSASGLPISGQKFERNYLFDCSSYLD